MDERHIVAIDLGTSKFALSVAKVSGDDVQIIYYRETPAEGIRNSRVFNPKKVSIALGTAISTAESELGIKIRQVIVGKPKYDIRQVTAQMQVERNENECITEEEIANMKSDALETYPLEDPDHDELFGAVAQSFSDGEEFQLVENDIIGMACPKIEGNFKVFIGKSSAVSGIEKAFNLIGVKVAKQYFTPDYTAKAVLYDAEMENGVALIDFGAGATSLSIYYGNVMRYYAAIPFGGDTITKDIKSECTISEQLAENIKLAFGACMPDKLQSLSEKVIQINSNSAAPVKQLSVKYLSEIITARVKEIIDAILYEIQQSGFADSLKSGIVLTGGCANLVNCSNYVKEISGYNVRTGYPKHLFSASGCEGVYDSSAAVIIGMMNAARLEKTLNCTSIPVKTEDVPATEEVPVVAAAESPVDNGTLFDKDEIEVVSKPKKPVKKKGITWFDRFKKGTAEVVGNLYDTMTNEEA
ncbi:MAG: cell division protein FtsA [Candidatus Cryptobacteroides sp.]